MPEVLPLFSSPVYINDEISKLDIPSSVELLDSLEYERTPNNDGWISVNQSLLAETSFSHIRKIVEENILFYLHEIMRVDKSYELRHVCSWAMCHEKGDWSRAHLHTNSLFSGAIYFTVPENSGQVLDFSCVRQVPTWCPPTLEPIATDFNIFNSKSWGVPVKPGTICIFPSHMMHQVSRSDSIDKRRCIAFNYFLTGKFGEKTTYAEF